MDRYWIWFKLLNIQNIKKIEMIYRYRDIKVIYNKLKKYQNLQLLERVKSIDEYNKKNNIKVLNILNQNYPYYLKKIYNPPILLYYKGEIELLKSNLITIFPGKNIDKYGINLLDYVCKQLQLDELSVISRMEIADKYIYNNIKNNIIILSNGIREDIKYKSGIILSEYEYDIKNSKKNILQRNRILTGISLETLVVQASYIDGVHYLVDIALAQGREISTFPGDIFNTNNWYMNCLINQGAKVINNVYDLLVYEHKNDIKDM